MRVIEESRSTSFLAWIGTFFKSSEANGNATQADVPKFPQLPEFTSEEDEELRDALSPTFDQLDINWFWWILEFLPISARHQEDNNQWVSEVV